MSGGVDSSVSAELLQRAGYEVVGVTCLFVDDDRSRQAAADAKEVCQSLGIEHVVKDCASAFEARVIHPFIEGYRKGLTPSPCIGCNAACKVPQLIEAADELGCEKVSTGHYARIGILQEGGRHVVLTALDQTKDQSYMLARLSQDQLARLVLPLGAMTKAEVRIIAQDLGFTVAEKPESQDICFIEGDHITFLEQRGVIGRTGAIVDSEGNTRGSHEGLFRYTLGQRKGIGIAAERPYYAIGKNADRNELVVGFKEEALIDQARVIDIVWQAVTGLAEPLDCMVKLRYRSGKAACTVYPEGDDAGRIELLAPQDTTAPGQFAVFYQGETVLGSAMIESVGRMTKERMPTGCESSGSMQEEGVPDPERPITP